MYYNIRNRTLLLIPLTLLIITVNTFSSNKQILLDSIFKDLYSQNKLNGNVLIAENDSIIYQNSFGISNENTKTNLNDSSIFYLASVSKQFTAMGIVLLINQGKLKLDDNISLYIPELEYLKEITIRNLLNHTSGIQDYENILDSLWDKSKIATNKDIVQIYGMHKPKLIFEPNTKYEYSNTGYALLAVIIENVSDLSFSDYLNNNIFIPLKMHNTLVYRSRYNNISLNNYAKGYVFSDSLKRKIEPDSLANYNWVYWLDGIFGQGGINSSTNDLLKWSIALNNSKLVPIKSIEEVFLSAELNNHKKTGYGLGWFIDDIEFIGKIAYHSGGWPGYKTYIEKHLDKNRTIIILQNNSRTTIPIDKIRLILDNKPLVTHKTIVLNDSLLNLYVGNYTINPQFTFVVSKKANQLFVKVNGQETVEIYPETDNKFYLKSVEAIIEFKKNIKGDISGAVINQGSSIYEALKNK